MIDIRISCENCNKNLPPNSEEAMFCAFECTFCKNCAENILLNVCPNCGGGFEKRPILPKKYLRKNKPRKDKVFNPVDMKQFEKLLLANKNISPALR